MVELIALARYTALVYETSQLHTEISIRHDTSRCDLMGWAVDLPLNRLPPLTHYHHAVMPWQMSPVVCMLLPLVP